ncbi:hypothetical protein GRF29_69g568647 [Pseudopithomyces chartarum]|uniref:Xylanolytic transcriptional activator regulatory domain-containing protein n=1 Tax=Pseudopithomyces chartarum TaxID=1892770 RepID=A0AAN6RGB9_9PLEO|nr:hypothetical protein GRF29_69g568647 [Pseudopithomyces chartarum]
MFSGLYSDCGFVDPVFANWNFGSIDPLQKKASALLAFCYPESSMLIPGSNTAHGYEALKGLLTADNLKHFLGLYNHFQNHWPMIHPSFDLLTASPGLILSMVCIGAVYSDRIGAKEGREEFWVLASIVRQQGLLELLPTGHPNSSALHQSGAAGLGDASSWVWELWLEQEMRIRVMYLVFLIDASLTIFFNAQPQFDTYDIQLPLPADDAAWEAKTGEDCASALGLRGDMAQMHNHAGSRRAKQLNISEVLQSLNQGRDLPHRSTNVYSKFILIHAIHMQIFKFQRQYSNPSSLSSRANSPQSYTDGTSNGSSGPVTPIDGNSAQHSQLQGMLRSTMCALVLWKRQWDSDMQLQYGTKQRPLGFCRDGIHYYFLAKIFLQSSRREDWLAPPQVRFQQVFGQLKYIRTHVVTDSTSKNVDIGSVTTVDDGYGLADLTLDMKKLFTPILDTPST